MKSHPGVQSYHYRLRGWLPENKDAKILDLGCGDGKVSSFFSEKFASVTGVDLNQDKLNCAKQVGIETVCDDVCNFLSNTNVSYNVIYAFDVVEHLDKDRIVPFLKLCFEKVERGGRVILQMPNPLSPFGFGVVQGDLTHVFTLSPRLAAQLLLEVGFKHCEWREMGPALWGYSLLSTLRFIAWRVIRLVFRLIHLIEAGERTNDPLTRVYLISAKKP